MTIISLVCISRSHNRWGSRTLGGGSALAATTIGGGDAMAASPIGGDDASFNLVV